MSLGRRCLTLCLSLLVPLSSMAPTAAAEGAIVLDVLEIIGKDGTEVAAILGRPDRCIETYQGDSCQYPGGIEITYIGDRADWIQVAPENEIPFTPDALRQIGLLPTLPVVRNPFRMHWDGHQGLAIVSLFGSGQYVALFQVRAFTAQ